MIAPFRQDTRFHAPVPHPRECGHLEVGGGHRIWWEEIGPADGAPVLIVHGGPGGGIRPNYRRLLNPECHRGIMFDQRGCGQSDYTVLLESNTTWDLCEDIERLRQARGIEKWVVVGGSWGSTLALCYAEAYPEQVAGIVVSGVFLAREQDLEWWWQGAGYLFPDVFAGRDSILSEAEREDPRRAFRKRILAGDKETSHEACNILINTELQTLDLMPPTVPDDPFRYDEGKIIYGRIYAHYDAHDFFLSPNQILANADRLSGIPGAIVAGRSDMCTPPGGAWDLHRSWPGSDLSIVAAAGHRWSDEVLGSVLVPEIERIVRMASYN